MFDRAIPLAEVSLACLLLWGGLALIVAWCVASVFMGTVVVVAERFLPALSVHASVARP